MEGIILLGILVALFIYAANRYNKSQDKIKQHVQDGSITPEAAGIERTGPFIGDKVIYVDLKQRHFENDTDYSNNRNCALAKALKEMFPNAKDVFVFSHDVHFNYNLPNVVKYGIWSEDTSTYQWEDGYTANNFAQDRAFALNSQNIGRDSLIRKVKLEQY